MKNIRKILGLVLALTLALSLGASALADGEQTVVKLGVVGENNEQWQPVIDALAEEGVTLELVKFADYTTPNRALADGEIDLNAFQHIAFLESDIEANGYDLTPIGDTILAPLGVYSDKIDSLDELQDGDTIAIPNDATNGGHAVDNGLNPAEDSIYLETQSEGGDNPYVNIIVARTEDADNELYQHIVELFQTDEVAEVINTVYAGAYIPAFAYGEAADAGTDAE